MNLIVDELLINYQTIGEGKDVLLIHGWGDDHRGLLKSFQNLSNKYKLTALDLPGFGLSQIPNHPFDTLKYAKIIQSFVQKLKLNPELVIAHSFGGQVAICALSNNFLTTNKLILIASAGIREYKQGKKVFIKLLAKGGKLFLVPFPKSIQQKVTKKIYSKIGSDLYLKPKLKETFKNILKEDISEDATKITSPTLLIYGEQDNQTPPIFGQKLNQLIKSSSLEIIAGAGHFVFIDQQDKVLKLVTGFIND